MANVQVELVRCAMATLVLTMPLRNSARGGIALWLRHQNTLSGKGTP